MKKLCLLLLYAGFCLPGLAQKPVLREESKPETVGISAERLRRIDRVMDEYVQKGQQAGIVVLVARNGRIVHYKSYGQDNMATKTPLKRDAIVRIASQTKAITSIAALILFEEGRFLLDDPISKYLPAFAKMTVLDKFTPADSSYTTTPARRPITIRQLLTHTSGISYPVIGAKEMSAIYAKANIPSGIGTPGGTLADAMNRLAKLPLAHQPGEKWTYGLSDDLLGYLIEIVSGQPLDQFLRTRLFEPLGMTDTYFYLPPAKHDRLATLYTEDTTRTLMPTPVRGGVSPNYPKTAGTYFSGGAGLSSTAMDYAIFLQMLLNGGEYNGKRILAPATVRMMLRNQIGDLSVGINKFGLGFELTGVPGATKLPISEGAFSWGGIFGTNYWADPQQGVVAIVLTQKFPNSFSDINDKFRVLVYQAIME